MFKLVQGGVMMQLAMKHFSISCPHSHFVLHLFLLCRIEGKVHLAAVWTRLWALSLWELMNFGHCRKFSSLYPTVKCSMQFWEELEGKELLSVTGAVEISKDYWCIFFSGNLKKLPPFNKIVISVLIRLTSQKELTEILTISDI